MYVQLFAGFGACRGRERVRLTIILDSGADPEVAAAEILAVTDFIQVGYSPTIGAAIRKQYMDDVLGDAEIIHQNPIIYQPMPGPQPRFDTSTLGTEVKLEAATASTEFSEYTLQTIQDAGDRSSPGADRVSVEGPIIHIGSIDDGSQLMLVFVNDRDYFEMSIGGQVGGSTGGMLGAGYLYGVAGTASGGGSSNIWVRVPLETSVVVLELDDGTTLWQRPIAGYGQFPIQGTDESSLSGTVIALAADGTTIGEWNRNN